MRDPPASPPPISTAASTGRQGRQPVRRARQASVTAMLRDPTTPAPTGEICRRSEHELRSSAKLCCSITSSRRRETLAGGASRSSELARSISERFDAVELGVGGALRASWSPAHCPATGAAAFVRKAPSEPEELRGGSRPVSPFGGSRLCPSARVQPTTRRDDPRWTKLRARPRCYARRPHCLGIARVSSPPCRDGRRARRRSRMGCVPAFVRRRDRCLPNFRRAICSSADRAGGVAAREAGCAKGSSLRRGACHSTDASTRGLASEFSLAR